MSTPGETRGERRLFTLSETRKLSEAEFVRRAQKLKLVEEELEKKSVLRDVLLSVRKSVDSEERVILGSSAMMLCLVSEYFEAMFEGDAILKGETIELSDKVTLPGILAINALAFGVLSQVQVKPDELASLMAAGLYFKIPTLTELCDEFINKNDFFKKDISNVTRLIVDLDHLGFSQSADEWITKVPSQKMNDLFMNENTLRMKDELFCSILESDSITLEETKIWNICLKWAKYQSEKNIIADSEDEDGTMLTYLMMIKPLIRFPLMSEEFMIQQVMPTKVISVDEFFAIRSVIYEMVEGSSLFCSSEPRSEKKKTQTTSMMSFGMHIWDDKGIFPSVHSIKESGTLLTHRGGSHWANAFIRGMIANDGTKNVIEFEKVTNNYSFYGVMESTEKPKLDRIFGNTLKGVGFNCENGCVYVTPSKRIAFGNTLLKNDRLRLTVVFSDIEHATLVFHHNGKLMGHPIKLEELVDLTRGLRFAVQTHKGRVIRICHE